MVSAIKTIGWSPHLTSNQILHTKVTFLMVQVLTLQWFCQVLERQVSILFLGNSPSAQHNDLTHQKKVLNESFRKPWCSTYYVSHTVLGAQWNRLLGRDKAVCDQDGWRQPCDAEKPLTCTLQTGELNGVNCMLIKLYNKRVNNIQINNGQRLSYLTSPLGEGLGEKKKYRA